MLGLGTSLKKGIALGRTFVKDSLKLYLDFRTDRASTLKFPCEGSTYFNASDQSVNTGNIFSGGETQASFACWIWADETDTGTNKIVGQTNESTNMPDPCSILWNNTNNSIRAYLADGTGSNYKYIDSNASTANAWHHVVVTFDLPTGTIKIYIDGVDETASGATNGTPPTSVASNTTTNLIGVGRTTGGDALKGYLANVAIWSRVLSIEEANSVMRKNYSQLKTIEKTSLVSWWALDSETESSRTPVESNARTETGTTEADSIILNEHGTTDYTEILSSTTFTSQGNWVDASGTHSYGNTEVYSEGALKLGVGYVHLTTSGAGFSTALVTGSLYKIEFEWTIVDTSHVQDIWFGIDDSYGGYGLWRRHGYNTDSTPEASQIVTFYHQHDGGGYFYFRNGHALNEVHIKSISCKLIDNNAGIIEGATTTTSVYGGNAPVLPRAVDVAREGEAEAIGNGSAVFDGSSRINFGDALGDLIGDDYDNGLTIAFWFKPDVTNGDDGLLTWGGYSDDNGDVQITLGSDAIGFLTTSEGVVNSTIAHTDKGWNYYTGVFDGSNNIQKLYINGILQDSDSNSNKLDLANKVLRLGVYYSSGYGFDGNIAQFGIWLGALTQAQIQSVMESTSYATIPASVKSTLGSSEITSASDKTFSGVTSNNWAVPADVTKSFSNDQMVFTMDDDTPAGYVVQFQGSHFVGGSGIPQKFLKVTLDIDSTTTGSYSINNAGGSCTVDVFLKNPLTTGVNTIYAVCDGANSYFRIFEVDVSTGNKLVLNSFDVKEVTNDLVGYWGLDNDSSPSALSFDGSNDYIVVPHDDSLNMGAGDMTATAWIKPTNLDANYSILDKRGSDELGILCWIHSGDRFFFQISDGTNDYYDYAGVLCTLGKWHHVCAVWNPSTTYAKFYLDGVDVGRQFESTSSSVGNSNNTSELRIGRASSGYTNNYFNGSIRSVSLYNVEKSPSEVASIYQDGIDGDESLNSGLQGYWKMDNASTVTDLSGNGNDGTVSGATLVESAVAGDSTSNNNHGTLV